MLNAIQIPETDQASEIEQIFRDHRKGVLTSRDYSAMNAAWVAVNLNGYQPAFFPAMPQELVGYVEGRILGHREEDDTIGTRLGGWVESVGSIHEMNRHNVSLLTWCVQKLNEVGLVDDTAKITRMIDRLNMVKLPEIAYTRALRCQVIDAEARKRNQKS